MKIAFMLPSLGMVGVETAFENLLAGLSSMAHVDITVYRQRPLSEQVQLDWFKNHPSIKTVNYYPLADWFENLRSRCKNFPLKQLRKIVFSLYKKYRNIYMSHCISKTAPDIVIDYVGGDSLKLVKVLHNIPTMVVLHGAVRSYSVARMQQLKIYDKILVLSQFAVTDIKKRYPQYKDKIVQCYNALDMAAVCKSYAQRDIASLGQYFLSVSRIDPDKDIITIIKAFDAFWSTNSGPNCNLVIIGDGSDKAKLETFSKKLPAANNIIFLGKIDRPYDYINGAIAHVLSSYSEALPTTIIESAAVGTLNIASDCPDGPREMLLAGKGGILFQPGHVSELAEIMDAVWNKRVDTQLLVTNMTKSLERFAPQVVAQKFLELVNQTIQQVK